MRQRIIEVIAYLLELAATPTSNVDGSLANSVLVGKNLEEAGFSRAVVTSTFDWLRELIDQQCWYAASSITGIDTNANKTFRVFAIDEGIRINLEVRNFILSLEYSGILDTKMREIVINQLMQLKQQIVDIDDAK